MPNVWRGHKSTDKLNWSDIARIVSLALSLSLARERASDRIVCSPYLDFYFYFFPPLSHGAICHGRPRRNRSTRVIYVRLGIPAFVFVSLDQNILLPFIYLQNN